MTDAALPAWQMGFPIETLRPFASIFKQRHAPLVFGAFGLTKEREIAAALAEKSLVFKKNGESLAAVGIVKVLKSAGHVSDVAGRDIVIPAGHTKIQAIAGLNTPALTTILEHLSRTAPAALWVEIFEEDDTAKAAVQALAGARYVATKIAAGSEVKGLYTTAPLDLPPIHPAENAALLVVRPDFASADDIAAVLEEIEAFRHVAGQPWKQHYSSYNVRKSWTSFALRGYDKHDPGFIIKPAEMAQSWKEANPVLMRAKPEATMAAAHFPRTMALAGRLVGSRHADRIRLMRLAPGGELSRHADVTDRDAGLTDGRLARFHIPIVTSSAVVMHGWDKRGVHGTTNFPAGALCYLDQRGPHRVENKDPNVERVHLVIDVASDAEIREQLGAALAA